MHGKCCDADTRMCLRLSMDFKWQVEFNGIKFSWNEFIQLRNLHKCTHCIANVVSHQVFICVKGRTDDVFCVHFYKCFSHILLNWVRCIEI